MKIVALLLALTLSACAQFGSLSGKDKLALVLDAATLHINQSTARVESGVLPVADANVRLKRAQTAASSLQKAQIAIVSCEGSLGKCDLAQLTRDLGGQALTQLADHLYAVGDTDRAEIVDAINLLSTLMQGTAAPGGGGQNYSSTLAPVIERFSAAVLRLQAAIAKRA